MNHARICVWLLLVLYSHLVFADKNQTFYAEPNWINLKQPDMNKPVPVDRVKNGTHYLLVDSQIQVTKDGKVTYYTHSAEHIVNQKGIENSSHINIHFNPDYQKLLLHKLIVWRNGKKTNKRSTARFTMIQPERESKEHVYNGEHSLNIILDDIRVGDTIEYSFSREGRNPVFGGGFDVRQNMQWTVPVGEVYRRIVWQKKKPLFFKKINTDVRVEQASKNGAAEFIISAKDVPAVSLDDKTPEWFDPYAQVYFSDTKSWQDVVQWGRELFSQSRGTSAGISDIANKIRSKHNSKRRQIVAALQYVQANVRYLSLSLGESSHRPAAPDVTLKRRFGDCKDKSALYIALLKELNITAFPALVNTSQKHEINKLLPAYGTFDHVIVQVVYKGKKYWFDPTRRYQFGTIDDIYQPDYGYALVLKSGNNSLETMNRLIKYQGVVVNEKYAVNIKQRDNVKYNVQTKYYGLDAEFQLDRIAENGKQETQKNYLEFYKNYYNKITTDGNIVISEVDKNGSISVAEKYTIADFWKTDKKTNEIIATFYTSSISSYLKKPKIKSRKHPYQVSHPVSIKQNTVVDFSIDDWSFDKVRFVEDNDFFYFKHDAVYDAEKLKLHLGYVYKSKVDYIPAERFTEYLNALDRAYEQVHYGIVYRDTDVSPNADNKNTNDSLGDDVWVILFLCYVSLICLGVVLWILADKRKPLSSDTLFYPVSVPKFIVMWVLTLGTYSVYWFYKNYYYIKQRDESSIMPIARGIFSIFWYYPLYKKLTQHRENQPGKTTIPSRQVGGVLAVLYFLSNVLTSMEYFSMVFMVVSGLLMLPMVNYIYHINDQDSAVCKYNSQFSFRHIVLAAIFLPLLLILFSSDVGLIPSDKVVAGDKLYAHDLKFMKRKGIIKPDDKIAYFYSDAFFSIRDDGNGFTEQHVFSYWKEEGELVIEKAAFSEIKDVDITWAKDFTENTVIKIIRNDGTEFLLFASREKRMDKIFGRELKKRWKKSVKVSK
ncbi:MAG: DUF3857 domain-containing protein [Gammaproteobacteria bacterium]|nr:DUF3857 domain-containing protein [Gammaproteobacteria bacterium]